MVQACLLLVRVVSTVALLLVATYYLLASIPFSYYHFLQFPHFSWMPAFIHAHPLVALASVGGLFFTLRGLPPSLAPWRRCLALGGVVTAACMSATIWVPGFDSYEVASVLCFLSIGLIAGAAGIDLVAHRPLLTRSGESSWPDGTVIGSFALGGALTAAIYLLHATLVERGHDTGLRADEIGVAAIASLGGHIALFTLAGLAMVTTRALAVRRRLGPWGERIALSACAAALLAWMIRRAVLTALILSELRAIALAVALGVTVVLTCQAMLARWWLSPFALRASADRSGGGTAGVRSRGSQTVQQEARGRWTFVAAIALLIFVFVDVLPDQLRLADWGFTLQKLLVLTTWMAAVGLVRWFPNGRRLRVVLAGAVATLMLYQVAAAMTLRPPRTPGRGQAAHGLDVGMAVDRYATIDTSLMVVLDLIHPVVSDADFFSRLWNDGQATDDGSLRAVPLRLAEGRRAGPSPAPNVFVIVIDSLRPDYLSTYNDDVTFTPAIGAFARESLVWRQAFTSYTGTALSQPSLWAGGLIQRRMYIRPFSAVNNLERFVQEGGYRRYISMDAILNALLEDRSNLVPLDSHLAHPDKLEEMFKFDLCGTVNELTRDLDRDARQGRPIFFYTQPQNLHIRVIGGTHSPTWVQTRPGGSVLFKPAVDTLAHIDGCFGTLIDYLKAKDLFANSIIVLTSDHGDAYGEGGLWGHAFYLTPEITRIPLIIHVPEQLRKDRYWDPDAVALLTDVTPTLYALTGYGPLTHNDMLGRELIAKDEAEARANRRERYFVQSSYNLNFALLDGHADWLYVANAASSTEKLFDLRDRQASPQRLTQADRVKYHKWLLDWIARLNAYYLPGSAASHRPAGGNNAPAAPAP
jgi:hypothetical protein